MMAMLRMWSDWIDFVDIGGRVIVIARKVASGESGDLDSRVDDMARTLASKSPAILKLGLEAFHNMSDMNLEQALRYLQTCLTINTLAEDAAEGVMAFIQKRDPDWKGR